MRDALFLRIDWNDAAPADRARLVRSLSPFTVLPPSRLRNRVGDFVIEPHAISDVERLARVAGCNPGLRFRHRHWTPAEVRDAELFALGGVSPCLPYITVWDSVKELDASNACHVCMAGHRWAGTVLLESRSHAYQRFPQVGVTANNAWIVHSRVRDAIGSACGERFEFFDVARHSDRRPYRDYWAMQGRARLPRASDRSLLQRHTYGCEACKRDAWSADDLSIAYESLAAPPASAMTFECRYAAALPTATRPGISAIPWIVVGRSIAEQLPRVVSARFLRLRPVLLH
jgi:hypothetical protein